MPLIKSSFLDNEQRKGENRNAWSFTSNAWAANNSGSKANGDSKINNYLRIVVPGFSMQEEGNYIKQKFRFSFE